MKQDYKCTFIDGLENDKTINGCKYVLLSTISPENILNCGTWGIKLRGFDDDERAAEKKAELLRKRDKNFDVFVGVNGAWHPMNPTTTQIEDEKFSDVKLNKIMKKIHESEKKEKLAEMYNDIKENKNNEEQDTKDSEYDIIKNLNRRKNEIENETIEQTNENVKFMFNDVDCLDEDPVIPDKRYAIVSFISQN